MTDLEKKFYERLKNDGPNGGLIGQCSCDGIYINDMTRNELVLFCNILAYSSLDKRPSIRVSLELDKEN